LLPVDAVVSDFCKSSINKLSGGAPIDQPNGYAGAMNSGTEFRGP
jgi:hypothetical protein